MCDSKLSADLAQIAVWLRTVTRSRGTTDHLQLLDLREAGDDIVLDARSEKRLRGRVAHILERQDRDRFAVRITRGRTKRRRANQPRKRPLAARRPESQQRERDDRADGSNDGEL